MTFVIKHIKIIALMSLIPVVLCIVFTAAAVSILAAAVSEDSGESMTGAIGTGMPEFITYKEVEYCVYVANERGVPASLLIAQIIMNKEEQGQADVFLMGKEYGGVTEAIEDYSIYITTGKLAELKLLKTAEEWANGIYENGVISQEYSEKIISTIDSYNLRKFDGLTVEGLEEAMAEGDGIASGQFIWPLPIRGRLTSPFGYRTHPVYGYERLHTGQDIAAPAGTAILAADGGAIELAGWMNSDGGYTVIIDHGDGIKTMYCHIMEGGVLVTAGQNVSQGQTIAKVGTTGASTGYHLHFSVIANGSYVDPMNYVTQPY